MRCAFLTFLASLDYLPGVITLYYSLRVHHPTEDFIVLTECNVKDVKLDILKSASCIIKTIKSIKNPNFQNTSVNRFKCTYSKLRMFELTEYDKIVYLDADTIVTDKIELLFKMPGLSAVIAGNLIPENREWKNLNSGVMVIAPDKRLFKSMLQATHLLKSNDKGDQGFLQSYYSDWARQKELHLNQRFNVPVSYLDDYINLLPCHFFYQLGVLEIENISILHYWGPNKPWQCNFKDIRIKEKPAYYQAIDLWNDLHKKAITYFGCMT